MLQKKKRERSVKHRHNIFFKFYCESRGIITSQRYPWDPRLLPGHCRESHHQDPIKHMKFCRVGASTALCSSSVACTGIGQWCISVIVRRETSLHSSVGQSEDDDTQWDAPTGKLHPLCITLHRDCWPCLLLTSRCSRTVVFLRHGLPQWLDGLPLVLTRVLSKWCFSYLRYICLLLKTRLIDSPSYLLVCSSRLSVSSLTT